METPDLVPPADSPLIFFRCDLSADSLKLSSTSASRNRVVNFMYGCLNKVNSKQERYRNESQ